MHIPCKKNRASATRLALDSQVYPVHRTPPRTAVGPVQRTQPRQLLSNVRRIPRASNKPLTPSIFHFQALAQVGPQKPRRKPGLFGFTPGEKFIPLLAQLGEALTELEREASFFVLNFGGQASGGAIPICTPLAYRLGKCPEIDGSMAALVHC